MQFKVQVVRMSKIKNDHWDVTIFEPYVIFKRNSGALDHFKHISVIPFWKANK